MANGSDGSCDHIVSRVSEGLLVKSFTSADVDVATGRFMLSVGEAYVIRSGLIDHAIKNAKSHGTGRDPMRRIVAVGNDATFGSRAYFCQKGTQMIPVGVAMPTILIDGMSVTAEHG